MAFEDGLKFKKKKRTTAKRQEKQKPVSQKSVEGELEVFGLEVPEKQTQTPVDEITASDNKQAQISATSAPESDVKKSKPLKIPIVHLKEF